MGERSIISPPSAVASPGDAVTAASHSDLEPGLASEVDRGHHVRGRRQRAISAGPLVDHAVVEPPCVVVAGVARSKEVATERGSDLVETGDLRRCAVIASSLPPWTTWR